MYIASVGNPNWIETMVEFELCYDDGDDFSMDELTTI